MSSAPTIDDIARDATWLAQALDPAAGLVRLIAMDRDSYRAASFLDDRMLRNAVDAQIVPWTEIEQLTDFDLRIDARWIFHIGHVGSTLLSRLLGELPGVLALREPRFLRDLALLPAELRGHYIGPAAALMSRTFAEDQLACVKATSFVSEIGPSLVPGGEGALLIYATPTNYIASILAGENSVKELQLLAEDRAGRLARRASEMPQPRNNADRAALAWACEMTSLEATADAIEKVEWLDFDKMLEDVPNALAGACSHFGFDADRAQLEALARGPLMSRYSKALEHDYSPSLRRELIAEATHDHRSDIESALAMLHSAAGRSPLLARAIARAES